MNKENFRLFCFHISWLPCCTFNVLTKKCSMQIIFSFSRIFVTFRAVLGCGIKFAIQTKRHLTAINNVDLQSP